MPIQNDFQLARRKNVQAGLSGASAALGVGALTAMGVKTGAGKLVRAGSKSGVLRRPVPVDNLRRRADKVTQGLTVGSVGVGGLSSANFASVQRAESKKIKKNEGYTMDFGLGNVHQGEISKALFPSGPVTRKVVDSGAFAARSTMSPRAGASYLNQRTTEIGRKDGALWRAKKVTVTANRMESAPGGTATAAGSFAGTSVSRTRGGPTALGAGVGAGIGAGGAGYAAGRKKRVSKAWSRQETENISIGTGAAMGGGAVLQRRAANATEAKMVWKPGSGMHSFQQAAWKKQMRSSKALKAGAVGLVGAGVAAKAKRGLEKPVSKAASYEWRPTPEKTRKAARKNNALLMGSIGAGYGGVVGAVSPKPQSVRTKARNGLIGAGIGGAVGTAAGASYYVPKKQLHRVEKVFDAERSRRKRLTAYSHGAAAAGGAAGLAGGRLIAVGAKDLKNAKTLPKFKAAQAKTGKGVALTAGAVGAGIAANRINEFKNRGGGSYRPRYINQ